MIGGVAQEEILVEEEEAEILGMNSRLMMVLDHLIQEMKKKIWVDPRPFRQEVDMINKPG